MVFLLFWILILLGKEQPCLVSLSAGALESGEEKDSAPALLSVVALEAVVAGARSATARTPHPGEEVEEDTVGGSAAGASMARGAAEGLP